MLRVVAACALGLLAAEQRQGVDPSEDGISERFPRETGRPDAGAALVPRPARQLTPVVPLGKANPCDGVSPEAQLSCPLAGRVAAIEPISGGVRLVVRKGPPADQLRNQLTCQLSLAAVKPDNPPACTFMTPGTNVVVRSRNKSTTLVEILPSPPDEGVVSTLREKVRTAFPRARR